MLTPDDNKPKVKGRIITTIGRPRRCGRWSSGSSRLPAGRCAEQEAADRLEPNAERHSEQWRQWRDSDQWKQWNRTIAPVIAAGARSAAAGRQAGGEILFDVIALRFADRQGGYTRVLRLAKPRWATPALARSSNWSARTTECGRRRPSRRSIRRVGEPETGSPTRVRYRPPST